MSANPPNNFFNDDFRVHSKNLVPLQSEHPARCTEGVLDKRFLRFLKISESDTRVPQIRARRCAQNQVHVDEKVTAIQSRAAEGTGAQNADAPHRGHVATPEGKGPFSPQSLATHPKRHAGPGMAQGCPCHAQTVDWRRHLVREAIPAPAEGFLGTPFS